MPTAKRHSFAIFEKRHLVLMYFTFALCGHLVHCTCPRKQFHLVDFMKVSPGKVIRTYGPLTLERCERTCRQFFECVGVLMTWHVECITDAGNGQEICSKQGELGQCQLLSGVSSDPLLDPPPNQQMFVTCPEGYERVFGGCYKFSLPSVNLAEAGELCRETGGQVLDISDAGERLRVTAWAERLGAGGIWTSGERTPSDAWIWPLTGESAADTFGNWAPNEPAVDEDRVYLNKQTTNVWRYRGIRPHHFKSVVCEL